MTKHAPNCKMAFGRKDPDCARCVELMNGAPARSGWQAGFYAAKARRDAVQAHKCSAACGVVCTQGEW